MAIVRSAKRITVRSGEAFWYAWMRGNNCSNGTFSFSTKYSRSFVMETLMVFCGTACPELDRGRNSFTTLGFTTAEASKKNKSKKNMMSFKADVCTSTAGLRFRFLKFI